MNNTTPTGRTSKYKFGGNKDIEDRYGVPENFLEIEVKCDYEYFKDPFEQVRNPQITGEDSKKYVEYEIYCKVFALGLKQSLYRNVVVEPSVLQATGEHSSQKI